MSEFTIGCAFHGGAEITACGCPPIDSPGAHAYRGLLAAARAEIDHLTAELTAARAVPPDVEEAIELYAEAVNEAGGTASAGDVLRTAIARAIADARAEVAPPSTRTAGELLGATPVGTIVECVEGEGDECWTQHRVTSDYCGLDQVWSRDWRHAHVGWQPWRCGTPVKFHLRLPARIVPAVEADADPATRGPIGKATDARNRCGVCAQPTGNKNHEPVGDGLPPEPTCDRCLSTTDDGEG